MALKITLSLQLGILVSSGYQLAVHVDLVQKIALFFHLIGMALWLGGAFTLSFWTARGRATGGPRVIAFTYGAASKLYRTVIGGGAWLSVLSGIGLMLLGRRPWFRPFPEHWLFQMQVIGLIIFGVTLVYVLPNARRLAALAESEGAEAPEFGRLVKAQAIAGSVVGVLLIYLVLLGSLRF